MSKLNFDNLTPRKIHGYGWKKDHLDNRDIIFVPKIERLDLPQVVDMRPTCPAVYDQGQLGSCTANAIAAAIQFDQMKLGLAETFNPSRLFIYYGERVIEGTVASDSGAQTRDGIKVVAKIGAPPEPEWPYDISKFKVKPPQPVFEDAAKHRALKYASVTQDQNHIMSALAQGYPVIFGFSVFAGFESPVVAKTGIVPMPGRNDTPLGGHAVLCVGYDMTNGMFIVRNSWGASWGQSGYFELPFAYMLNPNLASDMWQVNQVA